MSAVERPTNVALAQPDRVFGYEPKGRGFESLMPRQQKRTASAVLFYWRHIEGKRRPRHGDIRSNIIFPNYLVLQVFFCLFAVFLGYSLFVKFSEKIKNVEKTMDFLPFLYYNIAVQRR